MAKVATGSHKYPAATAGFTDADLSIEIGAGCAYRGSGRLSEHRRHHRDGSLRYRWIGENRPFPKRWGNRVVWLNRRAGDGSAGVLQADAGQLIRKASNAMEDGHEALCRFGRVLEGDLDLRRRRES